MSNEQTHQISIPAAPLKLAVLEGFRTFGEAVDRCLVELRHDNPMNYPLPGESLPGYAADSYLLDCVVTRYGTGEGRGKILESVRGCDLYILADVTNYSLTYTVCGYENHMSPDNHFQDVKRIISAANGKAKRITVIMPFLYEGRQHKRSMRESLDCALALRELTQMGVSNIVTFDAHDPRVQNAVPLSRFDSFMPTYQFLKALTEQVHDLKIDKDHLMSISPDEGAMNRAVYMANILGINMGMFYKRRDYSTVVNGKNPIVAHEFLGDPVEGKDCLVIDDMISSGESMLDVAAKLKERKARRVFVLTTFGLFTDGYAKFDKYYEEGLISKVVTTNLTYHDPELYQRPWYIEADMTRYLATIIDHLNRDVTISGLQSPSERIQDLLDDLM